MQFVFRVLAAGDAAFAGQSEHAADPTLDLNVFTGQASQSHPNSPVKPALHWHKGVGHALHATMPGMSVYELASHDVHTGASEVFENLPMPQSEQAKSTGRAMVSESFHHCPLFGPVKHCWNHLVAPALMFVVAEYACGNPSELGCCPSTYPQFAFSVFGGL